MRIALRFSPLLTILLIISCAACKSSSKTNENVEIKDKKPTILIDNANQCYVNSFDLYYDNGPYVKGPTIQVDTVCIVYSFEKVTHQSGVEIKDTFTYYLPLGESSVIFRQNKYSGKGYHGGHLIILKDDSDSSFEYIKQDLFNGGTLVRPKSSDPFALEFEAYCRQKGYR